MAESVAVNWWSVAQRVCLGILGLMVFFGAALLMSARPAERSATNLEFTGDERRRVIALTQASVRIEAETCDGRVSGSGFLLDGHLITNHHLVDGASELQVSGVGVSEPAVRRVEAVSPGRDLARAGPAPVAPGQVDLEASSGDPQVGEPVIVGGWIAGGPQWREAVVHLYVGGESYGSEGSVMLINPAMPQGFSGGPVLDRDGRVVGVQRAVDNATDLAVVVPLSELESWLSNPLNEAPETSCI